MFDSLAAARQLTQVGMERPHADAIANAIRQAAEHRGHVTPTQLTAGLNRFSTEFTAELSTLRTDVTAGLNTLRTEFNVLRTDVTTGLNTLRTDVTAGLNALRAERAAAESRLTWRVACMMVAQTVVTLGGLLVMLLLRG